jgi:hypothetical protein
MIPRELAETCWPGCPVYSWVAFPVPVLITYLSGELSTKEKAPKQIVSFALSTRRRGSRSNLGLRLITSQNRECMGNPVKELPF